MASFAPKDFSVATPKWEGGKATLTSPRFEYREFEVTKGTNAGKTVKMISCVCEFLDEDGENHFGHYDVGDATYGLITAGPEKDAEAVNVGPSIQNQDRNRDYRVYPKCDFAKFTTSLVTAGLSEAELEKETLTVLDGLEVEVYTFARIEGDKYPLLLIKSVDIKGTTAPRSGSKGSKPSSSPEAVALATNVVHAAVDASGGNPVTRATLVRKAMADLKSNPLRPDVVDLVGKPSFLESLTDLIYDEDTKTVIAA